LGLQADLFISHASEDKDSLARPLAMRLRERGWMVWFDEFELKLGDRLGRSIDQGLASARFGVVILSPSFFEKEWPRLELDGLVAREMIGGQKVILPVWHDLEPDEVAERSPTLAARLAVDSSQGVVAIVERVEQVLLTAPRSSSVRLRPVPPRSRPTPAPKRSQSRVRPRAVPVGEGETVLRSIGVILSVAVLVTVALVMVLRQVAL
jgi:hypothetical protein